MPSISSIPAAQQRRRVSPLADELSAIFNVIDDEPLLGALAAYRWTGRPGWSLRALWRAHVAGYILGLPTTNALVRRLQDDHALRDVCGFDELPSRWTFNRFASRLSHHTDVVEDTLSALTDRLRELLPDFGRGIAMDSSTVRSWSNPGYASDPEASFTKKTKDARKQQWWWGYKLHLATDTKYELPIAATVTTASRGDNPEVMPLLWKARERYEWFAPEYICLDAGYDAIATCEFIIRLKAAPIIPMRRLKRKYDPTPDDVRHFPPIPHGSARWHALYSTRQSVERCFSRLKQHRALDSHCKRGLRKVTLHALMGLVTMQAAAVVRAEAGETERVREVSRKVA